LMKTPEIEQYFQREIADAWRTFQRCSSRYHSVKTAAFLRYCQLLYESSMYATPGVAAVGICQPPKI
jgi:hypothetical protein